MCFTDDIDGSGAMSRDEVLAMVLSSQEAVEDSALEVKKVLDKVRNSTHRTHLLLGWFWPHLVCFALLLILFNLLQLDENGDGSISLAEFKDATRNDPQLLECFGRLFGVDDEIPQATLDADPYAQLNKAQVQRAEKLLCGDDGGAKARFWLLGGSIFHVSLLSFFSVPHVHAGSGHRLVCAFHPLYCTISLPCVSTMSNMRCGVVCVPTRVVHTWSQSRSGGVGCRSCVG